MAINPFSTFITTKKEGFASAAVSRNFTAADVGKFNIINTTGAITLTLRAVDLLGWAPDLEIIIRNPFESLANIDVAADGVELEVSGDLGFVIPPGGIMEIKRWGTELKASVYGYIEA